MSSAAVYLTSKEDIKKIPRSFRWNLYMILTPENTLFSCSQLEEDKPEHIVREDQEVALITFRLCQTIC